MASVKCGHCSNTHSSVAEVRACSQGALFKGQNHSYEFKHDNSPSQYAEVQRDEDFLYDFWCGHRDKADSLCDKPVEKTAGGDPVHVDRLIDLEHSALAFSPGQIWRARAGKSVDVAAVRKTTDRAARLPVTEGWYMVDRIIYKVQKAVHGSGNLYAKELVTEELADEELNDVQRAWKEREPTRMFHKAHWEYAKGAIRRIRAEHRLSGEEAAQFGRLYGVCVRCGLTLTKEESIERGRGDVCAGKEL
jgi:hypothetical protein